MPEEPKDQRQRFEQAARELGVDLDEDKLKQALRRMKDRPHDEGVSPEGAILTSERISADGAVWRRQSL